MHFPIAFLCVVAAASAAPQLFFVVPPEFLQPGTNSQSDLSKLVPLLVPFGDQANRAKSLVQPTSVADETPLPENEELIVKDPVLAEVADPVPEVASPHEAVADAGTPPVQDNKSEQTESGNANQGNVESTVNAEPEVVQELPQPVKEPATPVDNAEVVFPETKANQNDAQPQDSAPAEPEPEATTVIPEEEVVTEMNDIAPELSVDALAVEEPVTEAQPEIVDTQAEAQGSQSPQPADGQNNAEGVVSKGAEKGPAAAVTGGGKSLNSNSIAPQSNHLVTHFGFRDAASVSMTKPNSFMHHGAMVDPKSLVPPQFRSFIFQNDSPDVIAAKIAFFKVQAALTPVRRQV